MTGKAEFVVVANRLPVDLERADTVQNHLAVTGLAAAVVGAQLFVSTLVLHGTVIATTRSRPRVAVPGRRSRAGLSRHRLRARRPPLRGQARRERAE